MAKLNGAGGKVKVSNERGRVMFEGIVLGLLILLCVGWVIKMDAEGAKTMDLMGLVFGSIALGYLIAKIFRS